MDMLAMVEAEIEKLNTIRGILIGEQQGSTTHNGYTGKPRGRKPGLSKMNSVSASAAPAGTKKKTMSPEGRKAIADAMKARWAAKRLAEVSASAPASAPTLVPAKKSAKKAAAS